MPCSISIYIQLVSEQFHKLQYSLQDDSPNSDCHWHAGKVRAQIREKKTLKRTVWKAYFSSDLVNYLTFRQTWKWIRISSEHLITKVDIVSFLIRQWYFMFSGSETSQSLDTPKQRTEGSRYGYFIKCNTASVFISRLQSNPGLMNLWFWCVYLYAYENNLKL